MAITYIVLASLFSAFANFQAYTKGALSGVDYWVSGVASRETAIRQNANCYPRTRWLIFKLASGSGMSPRGRL